MSKMRLVLIEWEDSFGCSSAWIEIDDPEPAPMICKSVGWLTYDGEDSKVVVPHISEEHDACKQQGCGGMTIPARAITKITDLIIVGEEPEA